MSAEARATLVDLACDFAITGSSVYGLGAAAADLQPLMARNGASGAAPSLQLVRADLNRGVVVRDASVVIMADTAREVHPLNRPQLLADVYRGLRSGGCALVMEVTRSRDSLLNNLYAVHARETDGGDPHDAAETLQKAGTLDEEYALLNGSAFRSVDIFYKRYNLCGLIAIK